KENGWLGGGDSWGLQKKSWRSSFSVVLDPVFLTTRTPSFYSIHEVPCQLRKSTFFFVESKEKYVLSSRVSTAQGYCQ
ncbi:hypothetical protein TorRG33x02_345890, partial [Trema orientale]